MSAATFCILGDVTFYLFIYFLKSCPFIVLKNQEKRGNRVTYSPSNGFCVVFFFFTEQLNIEVVKLQKENLLLEQEKLHLQISLLKQHLLRLQQSKK